MMLGGELEGCSSKSETQQDELGKHQQRVEWLEPVAV